MDFKIILIVTILPLIVLLFFAGFSVGFNNVINLASIASLSIIGLIFSGFLIFIGMMVAPYYPKYGRWIAYSGVVGLMLLLLMIEFYIVQKASKDVGVGSNMNLWKDCSNTPGSWHIFLSCALTGHQPMQQTANFWDFIGIYGFLIFGLLVPLFILTALFSDFVESSGVVQNPTYQKIIGFGLGFMAYRGFIVTRLIYILDIGATGIAVIALNFIFLGGVLNYVRRSFAQFQTLEAEMEIGSDIEKLKIYLQRTADQWKTKEMVATNFSDPIFLRNLQLVVGNTITELLKDESSKIPNKAGLEKFKQEFKKAVRNA